MCAQQHASQHMRQLVEKEAMKKSCSADDTELSIRCTHRSAMNLLGDPEPANGGENIMGGGGDLMGGDGGDLMGGGGGAVRAAVLLFC